MDIYKVLQDAIQNSADNMNLTDYRVGMVIKLEPMTIKFDESKIVEDMGENIFYTELVLEKKINMQHQHTIDFLTHSHNAVGLEHKHTVSSSSTETSLSGGYETTKGLLGSYDSLSGLDGNITVTEGIKLGDKLLILRTGGGQKFIILSKIRDKKTVVIDTQNNWNWS